MAHAVPDTYRPAGGNWVNYCGVLGGIPLYTTRAGSVINPYSGAPATIRTAFNAAATGNYVELAAGTFHINAIMELNASGVELRGQVNEDGSPATIINYTGGGDRLTHLRATGWDLTNAGQFSSRAITLPVPGGLRGVTTVTLASVPTGLVVDQIMFVSSDMVFNGDTPSSDFLGHEHAQIVRVTDISGSDVSFTPAINADYLTGTVTVYYRTLNASIKRSGLRNLKFTGGAGHYIGFSGADECWAVNCETENGPANANHIHPYGSYRLEIRRHNAHGIAGNSNSAYCISPIQCSQMLVEDSHFHNVPNIIAIFGTNGSAFVNNYVHDLPYGDNPNWLSQIIFFHGGHSHFNLFEGNRFPASHSDNFGNTSSRRNVFFRNRMIGWDETPAPTGKTDNTKCFALDDINVDLAIVGNVLGKQGYHDEYERTDNEFANDAIFYRNAVMTGLVRKGNYNTVDDAVPASEALGGDTVPNSYIHTEKPSYFGFLPWPIVDPTNFAQSDNVQNLPAAYRAINNSVPPAIAGDILTLTQRANSGPVTELVKRAAVVAGVAGTLTREVIHHSGRYPSQPENGYVYAKHGAADKHAYVFRGTLTLEEALALLPSNAVMFSDAFAGDGALSGSWTVEAGTCERVADVFQTSTLSSYSNNVAIFTGTPCVSVDQYAKVSMDCGSDGTRFPSVMFRFSDAASPFYGVQPNATGGEIGWNYYTDAATFGGVIGAGSFAVGATDTWGFTVSGTGSATVVRGWQNPVADSPDSMLLWDGAAPDVEITADPGVHAVDTGFFIGLGGEHHSSQNIKLDNFHGGNL